MGRLIAFAKIDEIIKLIRSCEDQVKQKQLKEKFKFSERQAEDIVNLRLGQLTKLDGIKLNEERKGLEAERKGLKEILGDDKILKKLVVSELKKTPRPSATTAAPSSRPTSAPRSNAPWVEEPITVILSKKGWVRGRTGHGVDMDSVNYKDGDARYLELECKTTDTLTVLASGGKAFSVDAAALPSGRGDGAPMNTLINSGSDDIVWIGLGAATPAC